MVLFKAYSHLSVDSILRRTFTVILRCNFCCGLFISSVKYGSLLYIWLNKTNTTKKTMTERFNSTKDCIISGMFGMEYKFRSIL